MFICKSKSIPIKLNVELFLINKTRVIKSKIIINKN